MTETILFIIALGILSHSKAGAGTVYSLSESLGWLLFLFIGLLFFGTIGVVAYFVVKNYYEYLILFGVLAIISSTLLIIAERKNWKII